ncbi:MAG: L,D-transpeptidase [Xanthobacteraceae bacterium]|uniref:L,D-transpeptidase n=1 Tax=Pseudolabrys sp. TaxID=1960880 RepID=UPI003D0F609E
MTRNVFKATALTALLAATAFAAGSANAQSFFVGDANGNASAYAPRGVYQAPAGRQQLTDMIQSEGDEAAIVDPALRRQIVNYPTREAPGTIIVDTPNTFLYYVLGNGQAIRYGIGVGREGFTWSGVKTVGRKAEWPDWRPPAEMIARQPYLPRMTAGGPGNPLGARALYLAGTVYRIHGTNDPSTIGHQVSSGCIRLTNDDIIDLYNRVQTGAKVVVLPQRDREARLPRNEVRAPSNVTAYAPQARTTQVWSAIAPGRLY